MANAMNQHKKLAMGKMPAKGGPAPDVKFNSPTNSKSKGGSAKAGDMPRKGMAGKKVMD